MIARLPMALFLIVALLVNGVWHTAHADFHAPGDVAATADMSPAKRVVDVDHGGDTSVHPLHQQAYLYRVELTPPTVPLAFVPDSYLNRFVAGHTSRLFRPPSP